MIKAKVAKVKRGMIVTVGIEDLIKALFWYKFKGSQKATYEIAVKKGSEYFFEPQYLDYVAVKVKDPDNENIPEVQQGAILPSISYDAFINRMNYEPIKRKGRKNDR